MEVMTKALEDVSIFADVIHVIPRSIAYLAKFRKHGLPRAISFRIVRRSSTSVMKITNLSAEEKEILDSLGGGHEVWMQDYENAELGSLYYSNQKLGEIWMDQRDAEQRLAEL